MTRLDDDLRLLDPADPPGAEPDGELLLRAILARPVPPARAPRRTLRPRLVLLGATCLAAGAVALAMPRGTPVNVIAKAYETVSRPDTILHYKMRTTAPAVGGAPAQDLGVVEAWQAGDGARIRTITPMSDGATLEQVASGTGTRTWLSESNQIVTYDRAHAGPPPAPGTVRPDLGDPRTLLRRAQEDPDDVTELGEATVRGIPVLQFRVGHCVVRQNSVTFATVVSVRRDDYTPVRLDQPACGKAPGDVPGMTVDYEQFDVLPGTEENRRLLDMAPHPGAEEVDGAAIDAAEERADRRASRRPRRLRLLDLEQRGRAGAAGR
ncbi:MAG TPA: hypothetical protein VFM58_04425 [Solirubrobacteraceae bacterium]|nr:hypothetical protein [Solirubrobacteraceae bacterium]